MAKKSLSRILGLQVATFLKRDANEMPSRNELKNERGAFIRAGIGALCLKNLKHWLIPLTCLLFVNVAAADLETPANLLLEAGVNNITVSWDAVAGAESYRVYWRIGTPGTQFVSVETTETSYVIEGLTFGNYVVRVGACNEPVCAERKHRVKGQVRVEGAPGDLALAVEADEENELDFTVTASWSPLAGAAHYELRWKPVGGTFTTLVSTLEESYAIAGLSPGRYLIRVRAINEAGQMSVPADRRVVVQAGKIYWADSDLDKIQRSNLDGSDLESLITTLDRRPDGIALDVAAGKMYLTSHYTGRIQRASLDGSGPEDLVTGLSNPTRIALDLEAGKMYWTDYGADKIQRADLDGSDVEDLVTGIRSPAGIALDVAAGKMYWIDADRPLSKLQRANLDGSGIEDLVTGLDSPTGIALDLEAGKMYWTEYGSDRVRRANLNGSGVETLVADIDNPYDLALDVAAGKIYWTDLDAWDRVRRANLDGSNAEVAFARGGSNPKGIALDVAAGKIYWTDRRRGEIQRGNLNGSGVEVLAKWPQVDIPDRIALDVAAGKIYWASYYTHKIRRANLDGSNVEDVVTGLNYPRGIALDVVAGKIYWTEYSRNNGKIQRANMDGSGVEALATGLVNPSGIALDLAVNPSDG